ncbi:MAG: helix-hairpin-helix domain-containing protein [Phycisphaerales bacterium]|nr:helix-hairpin-helix domain-containing protein [Phycisphaerales bacterium]
MSPPNDPTPAPPPVDSPTRATNPYAVRVAVLTLVVAVAAWAWRWTRVTIPDAGQVASQIADRPAGLNPNIATPAELAALPGIGPGKAAAILDYRERHRDPDNPEAPVFRSIDDLDAVHGIGPATLERLAPWLYFDD